MHIVGDPGREQPTQPGLSDCASLAPKLPTANGSARRISHLSRGDARWAISSQ